jgi:hypothetical protein
LTSHYKYTHTGTPLRGGGCTLCYSDIPCHATCLVFVHFPSWSSLALGYRTPALLPTVCELERTPVECHTRRNPERSFQLKAHPKQPENKSQPPLKQPPKPHTYCKHSTYNHPQASIQHPQTRQDIRQPKRRCSPWTLLLQTPCLHTHLHHKPKNLPNKTLISQPSEPFTRSPEALT